jgi:uncharacterized Tic20 family protein
MADAPIPNDAFHETPPVAPPAAPAPLVAEWESKYVVWTHIGVLSALIGLPVVVSLVLWFVKRTESAFVDDHGKEAVNFQISLLIYALLSGVLGAVLGIVTCGPGVVLGPLAYVAVILIGGINVIRAVVAAQERRFFRYPMNIRVIQ